MKVRDAWSDYIARTYGAEEEFPWRPDSEDGVFRHPDGGKWFALRMNVPKAKLGLSEEGRADILTVKCDPILSGMFRSQPGVFPGYHMNKTHWLSILLDGRADEETIRTLLDGRADEETIRTLLDMSYRLTAPRARRRKSSDQD